MPSASSFTPTDETGRPPSRRKLRTTLLTLMALILGLVVAILIWGTWRYQAIVNLGKQAQEQAQAINRDFPFNPPPPGQFAPGERWAAMLRARERVLARVSPRVKQALNRLLAARKVSATGLALNVLPLSPDLQAILNAQMAALREEQMSLNEYQWLLGLAIREALAKGNLERPGEGYWTVLRQVEALARSFPQAGGRMKADEVFQSLQKVYRGCKMDRSGVLRKLATPDHAVYAIDWLIFAAHGAAHWVPAAAERPRSGHPLTAGGDRKG